MDIMMRLKGAGFSAIASEFRQRERRLGGGLPLLDFVEIVLQGLPKPKSQAEKYANVNALVDLFDAIDINGDGAMEFDEFTSFCVDAGMVATRVKTTALKHRYVRNAKHAIKTSSNCLGIEKLKWSPTAGQLMVIETSANKIKLLTPECKLVAEVGGQSGSAFAGIGASSSSSSSSSSSGGGGLFAKHKADGDDTDVAAGGGGHHRGAASGGDVRDDQSTTGGGGGSSSASTTSGGGIHVPTNGNSGIFVLDACFICKYGWLAISTTDFTISFYEAGTTHHDKYPLLKHLSITTHVAQLMLRFCDHASLLFTSGNDFVINVWTLTCESKALWKRLVFHQDMVMDVLEIVQHEVFVSCDLHKTIQLWGARDLRPRGTLVAHTHGVRQLVYSPTNDLMLSAGYEFDAYGWDLGSKQVVLKLSGHRAHSCSPPSTRTTPTACSSSGTFPVATAPRPSCSSRSTRRGPCRGSSRPRL